MRNSLYPLSVRCFAIFTLLITIVTSANSQITVGTKNASNCSEADGEATIAVLTNATGFDFEYAVDGSEFQSETTFTLTAGKHIAVVRDKNTQCTFSKEFTIEANISIGGKANVVFVIDDTGSMGEDIEGVKNSLLRILSSSEFADNSCNIYQLVTFKDGVSIRPPTTDLEVIRNQVSALFADGGGDCPEASAEALDAITPDVQEGGTIFLATDAATHSGVDITTIGDKIRAKGINFSVLLSGNCFRPVGVASANSGEDFDAYSDNYDTSYSIADVNAAAALPSDPTAIQTFSYLAEITGGTFAYVPEVKNGGEGRVRYENIAYNMIIGSIAPAIIMIEPAKAPIGSTLPLAITSSKTNFDSTTSLEFNDSAIIVNSIKVLSPTKLEALVTVNSTATLGFKDIKARTIDSSGIDTANGVGLLQVIEAPSTPTILSISPASGKTGENLTVTIAGINTNFSDSSVVNLGEGILVLKVKAVTEQQLQADIKIESTAPLGYHNISVTTGSEVATENVIGPFLVVATECNLSELDLGEDKTVYVDIPDSACTTLSVNGINEDEIADYKFVWSTGDTTRTIKVCPSVHTLYTVQVTKGDCTFSDSLTVFARYIATLTCPGNKTVKGESSNCSAVINGIDPVLLPVTSTAKVNYSLSGATTGKGEGSVSGKTFNRGITKVTYSLSHDSTKTCSFTVEVKDCGPLLNIEDVEVSESRLFAFVTVRLSNPGRKLVVVKFHTEDGSAIDGKDYWRVRGWLLFVPGFNNTAKVIVPIIRDNKAEGDEYFKIYLTDAYNAGIEDGVGVVTIKDDDAGMDSKITALPSGTEVTTNINVTDNDIRHLQQAESDYKLADDVAGKNILSLRVHPNPSSYGFTVKVEGNDNRNKVTLLVYDANSKLLEVKNGVFMGQQVLLGKEYRPGTYFIVALKQGKMTRAKVVKL